MGWRGIFVGALIGKFMGPLGMIIGAVIGHFIEDQVTEGSAAGGPGGGEGGPRPASQAERELVFCISAAAMLAKMAKVDGVVKREEIDAVEQAFRRLGFSVMARRRAIEAFRKAKDDGYTIFDYARDFRSAMPSLEVRDLFSELLWDCACADGTVGGEELRLLRMLPSYLGVSQAWCGLYERERLGGASAGRRGRQGAGSSYRDRAEEPPRREHTLRNDYELLGATGSETDDELRRLYREKATTYHPDVLRAQGLPDEMLAKATERMAAINDAWGRIKAARGMK